LIETILADGEIVVVGEWHPRNAKALAFELGLCGRCHLRAPSPEGASPSISTFLSHLWESLKDLHQETLTGNSSITGRSRNGKLVTMAATIQPAGLSFLRRSTAMRARSRVQSGTIGRSSSSVTIFQYRSLNGLLDRSRLDAVKITCRVVHCSSASKLIN
jgi:hypothetical protein